MSYLHKFNRVVIFMVLLVVAGCKDNESSDLMLKESDIQTSINQQLPINGLVNVPIRIPDELASLNGLFTERVIEDPLVEARIELTEVEVALHGGQSPQSGNIVLLAKPTIRTTLLGVQIEESLNVEIVGGLNVDQNRLYLTDIQLSDQGSFFLNNVVPEGYRKQFVANLNEWLLAYFSAYPLYQPKVGDALFSHQLDRMSVMIEDDLVRFRRP